MSLCGEEVDGIADCVDGGFLGGGFGLGIELRLCGWERRRERCT